MNSYTLTSSVSPGSLLRMFVVLPLSGMATLTLLVIMFSLVKVDENIPVLESDPKPIARIHMKPPGPIETRETPPERPQEPAQTPPLPPSTPSFDPVVSTGPGITRFDPPPVAPPSDIYVSDQLLPFIKVAPNYPTRASDKGIEGFVDVMFDVTEMGTTDNIRIVYAEPATLFNASVIAAIKRWKYKPKVVDGISTRAHNIRERIVFKLDK